MKIELLDLTVRELVEDYYDDDEGGVTGYGEKTGYTTTISAGVCLQR